MPILKQFGERSVSIPNATAQNLNLSLEALGALTRMCSYSDNFEFKSEWLQTSWGVGRDKLQRILNELRAAGHLVIKAHQRPDGVFDGQEWCISTRPEFATESNGLHRVPENPSDGQSVSREDRQSENTVHNKKEESNKKNGNEEKEGSVPPAAAAPVSDHKRGMEMLRLLIGPIPDGGAQAKALKWMLDNGATLERIEAELRQHISDAAKPGKDFRPSFLTVQKSIFVNSQTVQSAPYQYHNQVMDAKKEAARWGITLPTGGSQNADSNA